MKTNTKLFSERFNRWKNGESYWDIIGSPLTTQSYSNGKDDIIEHLEYRKAGETLNNDYEGYTLNHVPEGSLGDNITALVNLPETVIYGDASKNNNRLYKSSFDPNGAELFYDVATLGLVPNPFKLANLLSNGDLKGAAGTTLLATSFGSGMGGALSRALVGTHNLAGNNGVSKTYNLFKNGLYGLGIKSGIGDILDVVMALDGGKYIENNAIGKVATNRAISKAILKNIGDYKSNITPQIRTKIGDVEVDDPLLYYRLGSLEMADAFNRLGIVESEGSGYRNPMFAKGKLWYGIPDESTLNPTPVKIAGKWGLDLSKDNEMAPKTHLLVSDQSTAMSGANQRSGKINISARTVSPSPIIKNQRNIDIYGEDFIELYNKAYLNSELLRGLVTRVINNGGVRRVPEFTGAANKSNTTLYKFDPEYGYKKYDDTPTYKYKGGKDSISLFVSIFRPMLYNTLQKKGYHTNSMDNMLTQLAWESNYGKSNNAKINNNYGGIKNGSGYANYLNPLDFIDHYVDLIHDRYPNAFNSTDLNSYAKSLKDNGYYEDSLSHYSSNLNNMKSLRKAIDNERINNLSKYNNTLSYDLIMSEQQDAIQTYKPNIVLTIPLFKQKKQSKQIIYPNYILQPNLLPNIMDIYLNAVNGRNPLTIPGQ